MFKGGNLPKASLMKADGIKAAIDDGILSVPFQVRTFRTVFFRLHGQRHTRGLQRKPIFGKTERADTASLTWKLLLYIRCESYRPPDGTEREIAVMEVRVQ